MARKGSNTRVNCACIQAHIKVLVTNIGETIELYINISMQIAINIEE